MFLSLAFAASTSYFTTLRLRTYLHPFQQEEYDNPRLVQWWKDKRAYDRYTTLGLLIASPFGFLQAAAPTLTAILWLIHKARNEPDPTTTAKKALVLTQRARHIWFAAAVLNLPVFIALATAPLPAWLQVLLLAAHIQTLPLYLMAANTLLRPIQTWQNKTYTTEAHTLLARLKPTTIGLTGSFGKTSTKYLLNHILSASAPTLATPGSVNTPLGIARIVREQLQPNHQYFLAEMGAYGPGSIAGLCKLAPPDISCITAVGEAHYERFKSLETVAQAKFELAEATLARGGKCILNVDGIPDPLWQPRVSQNPTAYRLVSTRPDFLRDGDTRLSEISQTPKGLALTLTRNGESTRIQTPLFGSVQAGNIAVAFALAAELGLKPKAIAAALTTAQAAPHRLSVQQIGTQTLIDDAYNANPQGVSTALETLTLLAHADPTSPRRRILVTPGLVELGTAHAEAHAKLGQLAATHADIILVIQPQRIPTFVQAAKTTELHTFATLAEAKLWLQTNGQPTDVILLANDLPDRYEARWTL